MGFDEFVEGERSVTVMRNRKKHRCVCSGVGGITIVLHMGILTTYKVVRESISQAYIEDRSGLGLEKPRAPASGLHRYLPVTSTQTDVSRLNRVKRHWAFWLKRA